MAFIIPCYSFYISNSTDRQEFMIMNFIDYYDSGLNKNYNDHSFLL